MISPKDLNAIQGHFETKLVSERDVPSLVPNQDIPVVDSSLSLENMTFTSSPIKIGWRFLGVFFALAVVNLVCAIDATILAVALPVCICEYVIPMKVYTNEDGLDNIYCSRRHCSRGILGGNLVPPYFNRIPAIMGLLLPYNWPQASTPGSFGDIYARYHYSLSCGQSHSTSRRPFNTGNWWRWTCGIDVRYNYRSSHVERTRKVVRID